VGQGEGRPPHWRRRGQVPVDGAAIRRAREAKGWTREKLAAELACSYKTVERIEAGQRHPTRETVARIVALLGMGEEILGVVAARPRP
jgi:ribosome-binding protein aMBF1 (putative translation factor)